MKGQLNYAGSFPRFALKRDWGSDTSSVSLDELYKQFGSHCKLTDKLDMTFVNWFEDNYVAKLGRDFELVVEGDSPRNKVMVETSTVEVASSLDDATDRLRKLRHSDEVGHIESEIPEMPAARTKQKEIQDLLNAPETVMTGDDLERNHSKMVETQQRKGTVFTLNELAESVAVTPSSKEERERVNTQLAEVSRGVKVLTEEVLAGGNYSDSASSMVMVGGSNNAEGPSKASSKPNSEVGSTRRNKYFQGHQNAPTKPEVSIEDIVSAPSKEDSIKMISACKSHSVLKVAKSYLKETGEQKLVELIERRLRALPPFSS